MDEIENQPTETVSTTPPTPPRPSYSSGIQPKKKNPVWILMVIALLLVGGGIYFLVKKGTAGSQAEPSPSSFTYQTTEPATAEPASTTQPLDREGIKIQILNGTGIPREATFLQGKLRSLGYTQIEVANNPTDDFTATEVFFASGVAEEAVAEITKELESIYQDVETKTGSTGNYDVKIITGLQKGATAKPLATKTPTPTPRSTATAAPTATP